MTPDKTIIACTRPASRSNTLLERGPLGARRGVVGGAASPPGTAERDSSPLRAPNHGLFLLAAPGDPLCGLAPQPLPASRCVWQPLRSAPACVPALRGVPHPGPCSVWGPEQGFPECCRISGALACRSSERAPGCRRQGDRVACELTAESEGELRSEIHRH